jgi:hypothetical protein
VDEIVALHRKWHCRYKRSASALVYHGLRVTRPEVEIVSTVPKLFNYKVKHSNRFIANYIAMTWDTDIRFIDPLPTYQEPRQYLFVFLYDRPRYVVHAELLHDKSMAELPTR